MILNRLLVSFAPVILLASCGQTGSDGAENAPSDANVSEAPPVSLPVTEPPLDRTGLLLATMRAASAATLGQDDGQAQRKLGGLPFEVRIRFGCPSDKMQVSGGPFSIQFDEKNRRLSVRAKPDLAMDEPWIAALAGGAVEAVEGFKMRRPWLLDAACPPLPSRPPKAPETEVKQEFDEKEPAKIAPAPEGPWVGIAQFFTAADSRTQRRDQRAYEATKEMPAGMSPSRVGYDLVLSGRLRELPNGRVIVCQTHDPSRPANCVVSVTFDRVRIEQPDDRSVLAEWGTS